MTIKILPKPLFNPDEPVSIPEARLEVRRDGAYRKENKAMVLKVIRYKLDLLSREYYVNKDTIQRIIGNEVYPMNVAYKCEMYPCNNMWISPSVGDTILHLMGTHGKPIYDIILILKNGLDKIEFLQ